MEEKLVTLAILTYTKAQILKNVLAMPGPRKHQFRFSRYHSEAYQR